MNVFSSFKLNEKNTTAGSNETFALEKSDTTDL